MVTTSTGRGSDIRHRYPRVMLAATLKLAGTSGFTVLEEVTGVGDTCWADEVFAAGQRASGG